MIEIAINISNRKVVNLKEFQQAFQQLKDGKHLVTIKDLRKRSLPQNSYYWGVVIPIVRQGLYDAGYDEVRTNDDAHYVLKSILLKETLTSKEKQTKIIVAGSTAKLSIPQFNEYIERICRWSSEFLGIAIPSPNQYYQDFQEWEQTILEETTLS